MREALVTGGAGFIGAEVARALLAAGHRVSVLALPGEDTSRLAGLDVRLLRGDMRSPDVVRGALRGQAWLFHVAALYSLWAPRRLLYDVNVTGTRSVLEAALAEGVQRVVHTSSIAVFGGQGPGVDATEESPYALGTRDPYAHSKFLSHGLALSFVRRGLDLVIVAPTAPLGPGDRGPTGQLLLDALRNPVALAPRCEVNVADVRVMAAGHLLAAERGRTGESYLLGDHNLRLGGLVRRAIELAGLRKPVLELPSAALLPLAHLLQGAAQLSGGRAPLSPGAVHLTRFGLRADPSKARRELGLPSRALDETLRDLVAELRASGLLSQAA